MRRKIDKNFSSTEIDLIPQPLYEWKNFKEFIKEKNLSENFYPYFRCYKPLYNALKISKYFISYQEIFKKIYEEKKIVTPPKDYEIEKIIISIVSKIRLFDSSFDRSSIVFKELNLKKIILLII